MLSCSLVNDRAISGSNVRDNVNQSASLQAHVALRTSHGIALMDLRRVFCGLLIMFVYLLNFVVLNQIYIISRQRSRQLVARPDLPTLNIKGMTHRYDSCVILSDVDYHADQTVEERDIITWQKGTK